MRITPENSLLTDFFEDEIDLVKVWNEEFPVTRNTYVRARHLNALWAALTERGRIVGLQVWDWTVGEKTGSSGGSQGSGAGGSSGGSQERVWQYPVNGAVRPHDEIYWDGFKEGDTVIRADQLGTNKINALLIALNQVCQRYVNVDEKRGFLGLGDLLAYCKIGKLEEEDSYWEWDQWTNSDHYYNAWGFPIVPDRAAIDDDSGLSQEARDEARADRFYYQRYRPGTTLLETININDPRFAYGGGGFGPAQYAVWEWQVPGLIPESVNVRVSSADQGDEIPEDDTDEQSVPLPPFHEHINAVYYMIRALEYQPYVPSGFPDPIPHLMTASGGGSDDRGVFYFFCKFFRRPALEPETWIDFCTKQVQKSLDNIGTLAQGGSLLATAVQGAWYSCGSDPTGPMVFHCENRQSSRFLPYVPMNRPWESDYEQGEFPGSFPERYKVEKVYLWLDGYYSTRMRKDNEYPLSSTGWGGTAVLMIDDYPYTTPNTSNAFNRGLPLHQVKITGANVEYGYSGELTVPINLPRTIEEFGFSHFTLNWNLDPGKWKSLNSPVNQPPKVELQVPFFTNETNSEINTTARICAKIEEHTYLGGKVEPEDMKL